MANKSIQKALATLVTNSNFAENYMDFRSQIIMDLNLNQSDTDVLDSFYENNKNKFAASARILKKNRWDDIKSSLPIIVNHIDTEILNAVWDDYLSNCKITDHIPKNPLAESILFAKFAETNVLLTPMRQQLVKYERIRNEVTYKHHENFTRHTFVAEININEASLSNYSVYIHPCYRIEEFKYDIPKLINKNTLRNNEELLLDNCVILFFKNLNKEGIGTLRISNDAKNIINQANSSNNLAELHSYFQQKLTIPELLKFFKSLEQVGVLTFYKLEEMK